MSAPPPITRHEYALRWGNGSTMTCAGPTDAEREREKAAANGTPAEIIRRTVVTYPWKVVR